MSAQPQYDNDRNTPQLYGGRARATMPMAQDTPIISDAPKIIKDYTELYTRFPCRACGGSGYERYKVMRCFVESCSRLWTYDEVEEYGKMTIPGRQLPCGHTVLRGRRINWFNPPCKVCDGEEAGRGWIEQKVTLKELMPVIAQKLLFDQTFLNTLLDVIEDVYPNIISDASTEHRAVMAQTAPSVHHTAPGTYHRSEPTAPPAHVSAGFPTMEPLAPEDLTMWERQQIAYQQHPR